MDLHRIDASHALAHGAKTGALVNYIQKGASQLSAPFLLDEKFCLKTSGKGIINTK
jgi:hypothetical protein